MCKVILQNQDIVGYSVELNVARELKLAGAVGTKHIEQPLEAFEYAGRVLNFTRPAVVDVEYSFDGGGFTVNGMLTCAVLQNCTKCNDEFEQPFSIRFSERFLHVSEEEASELECYPFVGETLELDRMLEDLIILEAPHYGLCKPDCRGLCRSCGANLNNTQCSCSSAVENESFTSLKELAQLLKQD